MQRKLVSFDVFESIEKGSLTNAYKELTEAQDVLSKILETNIVGVHCYNKDNVYFEVADGTYLKANYDLNDKDISFGSIEEVVVDSDSETQVRKAAIAEIVEGFGADNEDKVDAAWSKLSTMLERVMKRGRAKKAPTDVMADNFKAKGLSTCTEAFIDIQRGAPSLRKKMAGKKGWMKRRSHLAGELAAKKSKKNLFAAKRAPFKSLKTRQKAMGKGVRSRIYYGRDSKKMREWTNLSSNVAGYLDHVNNGKILQEAKIHTNDKGEVVQITIPTSAVRNEGKVIQYKVDMLTTDFKYLREQAQRLVHNEEFCRLVSDLKKQNNISDNEALEECINTLVGKWPHMLYLSQAELANTISEALKSVGAVNFDNETCNFMAEGIMRTAYEAFPEKVEKIVRLANIDFESQDHYQEFQTKISDFYQTIDESITAERKICEDFYNAFSEIESMASADNDLEVKQDAMLFLDEIEPILEGKAPATLDLVEEAAEWLELFIEENMDLPNPVTYPDGANATLDKWAHWSKSNPADSFDDVPKNGALGISSDSMEFDSDETKKHGWGNFGGNETAPVLTNPYLPKSMVPQIVGEKDIDSDDSFGTTQNGDTWPNLSNPNLLNNLIPKRPTE